MEYNEKIPELPILEIRNVSKSYSGVKALHDVSIKIGKGEVHGLMGENGAGKSTLMKTLIGLVTPDNGEVFLDGERTRFGDVHEARKKGLSMVHQELMPFHELTVAENIYMGNLPVRGRFALIDKKKMYTDATTLLKKIGCGINVTRRMKELSISEMQMIEIAKAIANDAKVIIMDEPTSAITQHEVEQLFGLIEEMKNRGIAIIYISHKMDEIFRICDRISVLRDGRFMGTYEKSQINVNRLIELIVGRELKQLFHKESRNTGKTVLSVRGISGKRFTDIGFEVRKGEVLGLAGLMGSGRTDIVNAIFGLEKINEGSITLNGIPVDINSPRAAIHKRIALVSEDRKRYGLVLDQSVGENIMLSSMHKTTRGLFISGKKENELVTRQVKKLGVKLNSIKQKVSGLSGGNQQKVVLGKVLLTEPEVLILDEPTRGIDIGAKAEIYSMINDLAAAGKAVILVSSELPEILGLSDRILVIHEGKIRAELNADEATQEVIMKYAMT